MVLGFLVLGADFEFRAIRLRYHSGGQAGGQKPKGFFFGLRS